MNGDWLRETPRPQRPLGYRYADRRWQWVCWEYQHPRLDVLIWAAIGLAMHLIGSGRGRLGVLLFDENMAMAFCLLRRAEVRWFVRRNRPVPV